MPNSRLQIRTLMIALVMCGTSGFGAGAQNRPLPGKTVEASRVQSAASARDQRKRALAAVKSWGYQLRQIRYSEIAASPFDLVVIDHALSVSRRFISQFSPEQIEHAKAKPDGGRRIVLAYLSIGEAEVYRYYWDLAWHDPATAPAWLGELNPAWAGNYLVRFWHPDWQSIILDSPESYLARIQAAGFDGIYLDRSDVYDDWKKENPAAEDAIASFLQRIAATARQKDPGFLILMQNAEELARRKPVLDAIDGIAKEDLFYGIDHKASENDPESVMEALSHLRHAKRADKAILVVEYLDEPHKIAIARTRAAAEGFPLHITRRDLGLLAITPPGGAIIPAPK